MQTSKFQRSFGISSYGRWPRRRTFGRLRDVREIDVEVAAREDERRVGVPASAIFARSGTSTHDASAP